MKATTTDDFKELEIWKNMLHDLQEITNSKIDFLIHRINYIESEMKYKPKKMIMLSKKQMVRLSIIETLSKKYGNEWVQKHLMRLYDKKYKEVKNEQK